MKNDHDCARVKNQKLRGNQSLREMRRQWMIGGLVARGPVFGANPQVILHL
jgi:hypothetical protein